MKKINIYQGRKDTVTVEGYSRRYETEPIYEDGPHDCSNQPCNKGSRPIGTNVLVDDYELLVLVDPAVDFNWLGPVLVDHLAGEFFIAAVVYDDDGQHIQLMQHGTCEPIWFDKEEKE